MCETNKIPIPLKEAVENDNLVIFVGAGLSYCLKNERDEEIGDWDNLVDKMLDYLIEQKRKDKLKVLKPLVEVFSPLRILELLEDKKVKNATVQDFLKSFFTLKESNDFSVHENLCKLSNKIITTNYDKAFEMADSRFAQNVAYKGRNAELNSFSRPEKPTLLKLHGSIGHIDEMVLFPTQYKSLYENFSNNSEHTLMHFKDAIRHHTILFIGTGMGDFQIKNIFEQLKEVQQGYAKTHFIVSDTALDSRLEDDLGFERVKVKDYKTDIPLLVKQLLDIKENRPKSEKEQQYEIALEKAHKKVIDLEKERLRLVQKKGQEIELLRNLIKQTSLKHFSNGLKLAQSKEYIDAIREFEYSIDLDPNDSVSFYNLGVILYDLADLETDEVRKGDLYNEAISKYKEAIKLNPNYSSAFNNLGSALSGLADLVSDLSEKERLYNKAISKYKEAVKLDPNDSHAFNNWGGSLSKLGDLVTDLSEKERVYKEAISKYEQAIELNPNNSSAFNNLGVALSKLAGLTSDLLEKEQLYKDSIIKYEEAIKLNPNYSRAYNNWGSSLSKLGDLASDLLEKEQLYKNSISKYEQAIELDTNYSDAFNNWGSCLSDLAGLTSDLSKKERLYREALEVLKRAVELGGYYYNLACCYALLGEEKEALLTLKGSLEKQEINVAFVEADSDWDRLRDNEDFINLLDKYRK